VNLSHQDLARAEIGARLGAAQECRRGRRLVRAQRFDRRAEQLAQRARLALARTF
jgi:hypothetical protein